MLDLALGGVYPPVAAPAAGPPSRPFPGGVSAVGLRRRDPQAFLLRCHDDALQAAAFPVSLRVGKSTAPILLLFHGNIFGQVCFCRLHEAALFGRAGLSGVVKPFVWSPIPKGNRVLVRPPSPVFPESKYVAATECRRGAAGPRTKELDVPLRLPPQ